MKRELTCIVCPVGCSLIADLENGKVVSVSGNSCQRGRDYAQTECVAPMRSVTTTMRCCGGEILPVKTDRPIPKNQVMDCMKIINQRVAHLPIAVGDVIIENVFGANIVATKNMGGLGNE
ncbi:MAG: DUF1667 domain-containing protein [Clostridia bacterium]|nr:DUF1667 domain-containing protein [Clostridia bacterium]